PVIGRLFHLLPGQGLPAIGGSLEGGVEIPGRVELLAESLQVRFALGPAVAPAGEPARHLLGEPRRRSGERERTTRAREGSSCHYHILLLPAACMRSAVAPPRLDRIDPELKTTFPDGAAYGTG